MKRIVIVFALLTGITSATYAQTQSKTAPQKTGVAPKMDPLQKTAQKMTDEMNQYLHLTKEQYDKVNSFNISFVSMQQQLKTNPKNEHLKQDIETRQLEAYRSILDGKRFHDYMEHNHIDINKLKNLH